MTRDTQCRRRARSASASTTSASACAAARPRTTHSTSTTIHIDRPQTAPEQLLKHAQARQRKRTATRHPATTLQAKAHARPSPLAA
eukprot:scaffold1813_cov129-Isochrysis_galbana.AAC.9